MKKSITIVCTAALFMLACGGGEEKSTIPEPTSTVNTSNSSSEMHPGQKLIAKSDCIGCHSVEKKLIGPSYQDIAAKYAASDIDMLSERIINGSKGVWGTVPMTPHPNISSEESKEMVKYILTLKK